MKVTRVIEQVLYEKEKKEYKGLNVYYKTDIIIKETEEDLEQMNQQEQPAPQEPVAPEMQQAMQQPMGQQMGQQPMGMGQEIPAEQIPLPPGANESTMYEETFAAQNQGKVKVSPDSVDNIQSLEDLLDFLANKNTKKGPILNDVAVEIIMNMATQGPQSIQDIISKDDRILVTVDYGKDLDNSVGFKALKAEGTNTLSLVMKKDNKVIPGPFNIQEFNKQVVFFRNSVLSD